MKLIVNADDFGLSRGVNFGIVDAFHLGIVRSTTLMATGEAYDHALELSQKNPGLGIGIHLILTYGRPVVEGHKTLVDDNGAFFKLSELEECHESFEPEEVEREFSAQIERVLKSGIVPTHLDSHHHVHMLKHNQEVMKVLSKRYSLPYRGDRAFSDRFYGPELSIQHLIDILEEQKDQEVLELMAHPAYVDATLKKASSYALPRVNEYEILTSDRIRDYLSGQKIELINFNYLK